MPAMFVRQGIEMKTNEKKPKIGDEIIFIYDDIYHIGYLISYDGSDKPRKWLWYSYLKGYDVIDDIVEDWFEFPSPASRT